MNAPCASMTAEFLIIIILISDTECQLTFSKWTKLTNKFSCPLPPAH